MNKLFVYLDILVTKVVHSLGKWSLNDISEKINSPHLSVRGQVLFYKRLAMMLLSGMSLKLALEMMATEGSNRHLKMIVQGLLLDVTAGLSLAAALAKYPKVFSGFSVNLIMIGEQSGTLASNLNYVSIELRKKYDLRNQIIGALVYPAIIIVATFAITIFLIVYIFPKIVPIFSSLNVVLPLSTRLLMALSDFLLQYGLLVLVGMFFLIIVMLYLSKRPAARKMIASVVLQLPIFGKITKYYNLAHITRTLGLLLKVDIPIVSALAIINSSTSNVIYKAALWSVEREVSTGKSLATELEKTHKLFPLVLVQMVKAGEVSGHMSDTLTYVSEMYESDIRDWTRNLTTMIEPVLMLVMGLMVGFIAISIITPIYGITQNIHP